MFRPFYNMKNIFIKLIIEILLYTITCASWCGMIFIVEETRKNTIFSIESIITIITLSSLMLQNLKVNEIKLIQDKLAVNISIFSFLRRSWHIFGFLAIFIVPLLSYELKSYLIDDTTELKEYWRLSKLIIFLAFVYSCFTYFLSFWGKDIDESTNDNVQKKYGVFYGVLLLLYFTVKLSATS
ncbi:hypothetical protein HV560_03440 [Mannheimia pernigra]|uniref:Uncharacterized protein n=2 Tax=Mannheimia pernigra TaxID=111844 RepID=A0ABD7A6Y0_9PAST|nr:hypothetical protein HV560_03440 [Mannheimia pernigra]